LISADEVLKKIIQVQIKNGYSDQEMAGKIGCSRPLYQRTRTGKISPGGTFLRGAMKIISADSGELRKTEIVRETAETRIALELNIDGTGQYRVETGIGMLDHLLAQLARHGLFDIKLKASGDDTHHLTEDIAICLGKALGKALGEKRGIVRMADATVPMDETLVSVALDISGRGYSVVDLLFSGTDISGLPSEMVRHFLETFAIEGKLNLHARVLYGNNDHHKAEALFKALGKSLEKATRIELRTVGELPSTKGYIEK
jgi:imidazoleglycerol-phosphate dehydratase